MPPSIWARTMSGLIAVPQSTAHVTRSTLGRPSGRSETSAICATTLPKKRAARCHARGPRERLAKARLVGREVERGEMARVFRRSARRRSSGSRLVACATSSRNVSVENAVCELPTERHQRTGTPTSVVWRSTERFGKA